MQPDILTAAQCECWHNKRGEIIYTDPCPVHSLTRKDSLRIPLTEEEQRGGGLWR